MSTATSRNGNSNPDTEPDGPRSKKNSESPQHISDSSVTVTHILSTHVEPSSPNSQNPALPDEVDPPLPLEIPPSQDDGWDPIWDDNAQAYYFYNRFTGSSQWTNPRVPDSQHDAPGVGSYDRIPDTIANNSPPLSRPHGGYDPAIHGDYDPNAPYAQEPSQADEDGVVANDADPNAIYTATGVFNRFTGKWQPNSINPENHNDENKSKRQMSAFFDVDAAANSHNGKSLKAERSGKKLTKQELKAFKEKRKEKKEERRRAWLRD